MVDIVEEFFECITIPPAPDPMELNLPGGLRLKHQHVLEQAAPALAPLVPIFDIIGVIAAIPDAITSLDVGDLLNKVAKLARLLPAASVPQTVVNIIDAILAELNRFRGSLRYLVAQLERAAEAAKVAQELSDDVLADIVVCAETNCKREAANLGKSLATVNIMLSTLNDLLRLAGIGISLPDLSEVTTGLSGPIDQVFEPLDLFIETLTGLRNQIPVP